MNAHAYTRSSGPAWMTHSYCDRTISDRSSCQSQTWKLIFMWIICAFENVVQEICMQNIAFKICLSLQRGAYGVSTWQVSEWKRERLRSRESYLAKVEIKQPNSMRIRELNASTVWLGQRSLQVRSPSLSLSLRALHERFCAIRIDGERAQLSKRAAV